MSKIKVIDLFAGPGGLGEGFSRFSTHPRGKAAFDIVFSAEKTLPAVRTLRLRTFFRLCKDAGEVPESYYDYLKGVSETPFDHKTKNLWEAATEEAQPLELGTEVGDRQLEEGLKRHLKPDHDDWVLIGGPPCQAYSLVGRARNRGIAGYKAEDDNRHFLYKEYLKILANYRPAAFVMENVKGILSSKVGNERIFPQILKDLTDPSITIGTGNGPKYRIHSFVTDDVLHFGENPESIDTRNFIIRSEDYGIPQARHRVILLGIREDGPKTPSPLQLKPSEVQLDVETALYGLPELRSGLSRHDLNAYHWKMEIKDAVSQVLNRESDRKVIQQLKSGLSRVLAKEFSHDRGRRYINIPKSPVGRSHRTKEFLAKLQSDRLQGVANHFARGHMPMDLARYLYASTFAEYGSSPKASDYPASLAPQHKNWNSGNFSDRFRVQRWDSPSTTVLSHISKDGHYFIHPDPAQCRSLTVREAARLQTFPDDYFFEGNRTEQYVQVGNAVPPMLAEKIAEIVHKAIS